MAKRVTYKTLSEWLAKGNGQVKERGVFSEACDKINTHIEVDANENMGQIEFDSDDV